MPAERMLELRTCAVVVSVFVIALLSGGVAARDDALSNEAPTERAERVPMSSLDTAWTFSAYFENDLFADTDQQYTNGIKLSWVSPEVSQYASADRLPPWTHPYIDKLPFIHRTGPEQQRNVVLSIGQAMYTPRDIDTRELVVDDRPYAGWLYLGAAFQNRSPTRMDDLEVQVGIVGPFSLAREAQTLVHEIRGLNRPRGWDNQLHTEPAFAFVYHRLWRFAPPPVWRDLGFDVISNGGGALGTAYTYLDGGVLIRAGWRLPGDFGSTAIRPGSETSAPIEPGKSPRARGFGVQLFAGTQVRWSIHDLFLDGNTFGRSHSVDKKALVVDATAGVSVVWRSAKLSFAKVLRTREFEGQRENHRFGSLTLSISY